MIESETNTEVTETPEQETATIPLSLLGGQQVSDGDVVRLKVLGVDTEGGSVTVAYAHPPAKGGINKMASAFDEPVPEEG